MAESTKNMTVGAGSASASVTATVTDQMPGVPCPATPGYTYTGMRYVPVFADPPEWSSANTYEPLEIVIHEGNSYTSKTFVPVGIDISNSQYWVNTGNFNMQLEQYRQQVVRLESDLGQLSSESLKYISQYGAVGDGTTDDTDAFEKAFATTDVLYLDSGKTYVVSRALTTSTVEEIHGNGAKILNKSGVPGADVAYLMTFNVESLSIDGLTFDSNVQSRGSILFNGKRANITNCQFTGYSKAYGYYKTDSQLMCNQYETVQLSDLRFYDNGFQYGTAAEDLNRCITVQDTNGTAIISSCSFERVNQAIVNAGAVCQVSNCKFEDYNDNALYDLAGDTIVSNCYFGKSQDEAIITAFNLVVSNCMFYNVRNRSIGITGDMGNLTVNGCTFYCDSTLATGIQAIKSRDDSYTVQSLSFIGNVIEESGAPLNYCLNLGTVIRLSICNNVLNGASISSGSSAIIRALGAVQFSFMGNTVNNSGVNGYITVDFAANSQGARILGNNMGSTVRMKIDNSQIHGCLVYKQDGVSNIMEALSPNILHFTADPTAEDDYPRSTVVINGLTGSVWVRTQTDWVKVGGAA